MLVQKLNNHNLIFLILNQLLRYQKYLNSTNKKYTHSCVYMYAKIVLENLDAGSIENKIQMFNILNFFCGSTSNRGWRGRSKI